MIHKVSKTFLGSGTNNIGSNIRGYLLAVKVVADSAVTDNFDVTLTGATSGIPMLLDITVTKNTTTWWHPRVLATNSGSGAAATDAFVEIPICDEPIQCVTANAGATGEITVTAFYDTEQ